MFRKISFVLTIHLAKIKHFLKQDCLYLMVNMKPEIAASTDPSLAEGKKLV